LILCFSVTALTAIFGPRSLSAIIRVIRGKILGFQITAMTRDYGDLPLCALVFFGLFSIRAK